MAQTIYVEYEDNKLISDLFGEHDSNLKAVEKHLSVTVCSRGNQLAISGEALAANAAAEALNALYARLEKGLPVEKPDVEAALRIISVDKTANVQKTLNGEAISIRTPRKVITPRSANQGVYMKALNEHELVFGLGPAGTGKTYLAVAKAVEMLYAGKIARLILSRPAVEAGEQLGFLPGDLRAKVDPYLRPLYDALHDMMPAEQVEKRLERGEIEVAPLAFMRGRTLSNAYVILDEAQNTTRVQMKMFLTRLGENSRMAITGDLSQVDLPKTVQSGLREAIHVLDKVKDIGIIAFDEKDVVRHNLVGRIVTAYNAYDKTRGDNPYEIDGDH